MAMGLRQCFALLARSGISGTAQTWEGPKSLATWSETGTVFPTSGSIGIASFSLTSELLDLGVPASMKPEKQCGGLWPFSWKKVKEARRSKGCADPSPHPLGIAA